MACKNVYFCEVERYPVYYPCWKGADFYSSEGKIEHYNVQLSGIPDEVASRWREVMLEFDRVQKEIDGYVSRFFEDAF